MISIINEKIRSNNVDLDANYGPYISTTDAIRELEDNNKIKIGVTVGIQPTNNDPIVEWWILPNDLGNLILVKKQVEDCKIITTNEIDTITNN